MNRKLIGGLIGLAAILANAGCGSKARTNAHSLESGKQRHEMKEAQIDNVVANKNLYRVLPRDLDYNLSYDGNEIPAENVLDFILTPRKTSATIRTSDEIIVKPMETIYLVKAEVQRTMEESLMEEKPVQIDYDSDNGQVFVITRSRKLPQEIERDGKLVAREKFNDAHPKLHYFEVGGKRYGIVPAINSYDPTDNSLQFIVVDATTISPLSFQQNGRSKEGFLAETYIPISSGLTLKQVYSSKDGVRTATPPKN